MQTRTNKKAQYVVHTALLGGGTESGKNAHRNIQDKRAGVLLRR